MGVQHVDARRRHRPCAGPHEILDAAYHRDAGDRRQPPKAAILHLAAIWNKPDPKIKAAVYSTAVTVCDPWLDPHVVAATDITADDPGEWVDLDWLLDTGPHGNQANTLYLLVSNDDYKRLSPVLAGLLSRPEGAGLPVGDASAGGSRRRC